MKKDKKENCSKTTSSLEKFSGIKIFGLLLIFLIIISSCGTNKAGSLNGDLKNISQTIKSGDFRIENEWALPMRGNMINLIGNPNYISFKGDSVNLFLPYFGVRQTGGGYGDAGGIEFKGRVENFSLEERAEDDKFILRFEADQGSENLDFLIFIYSSGNTNTTVTSSERDGIVYRGKIRSSDQEESN